MIICKFYDLLFSLSWEVTVLHYIYINLYSLTISISMCSLWPCNGSVDCEINSNSNSKWTACFWPFLFTCGSHLFQMCLSFIYRLKVLVHDVHTYHDMSSTWYWKWVVLFHYIQSDNMFLYEVLLHNINFIPA